MTSVVKSDSIVAYLLTVQSRSGTESELSNDVNLCALIASGDETVCEFLRLLALCHTVIAVQSDDGK